MKNKVKNEVKKFIEKNFTEKEVYNDIGVVYEINDDFVKEVVELYLENKGAAYYGCDDYELGSKDDIEYFLDAHFYGWVDKEYSDQIAEDDKNLEELNRLEFEHKESILEPIRARFFEKEKKLYSKYEKKKYSVVANLNSGITDEEFAKIKELDEEYYSKLALLTKEREQAENEALWEVFPHEYANKIISGERAAEILGVSRSRVSFLLKRGTLGNPEKGIEFDKVMKYKRNRKTGRPLGSYKGGTK